MTRAITAMRTEPEQFHPPRRREFLLGALAAPLITTTAVIATQAATDPDAELCGLCAELATLKDWINHPDFPDTDEAINAASDRDIELCRRISRTPARTQRGLMWKARITAREHGLNRFVNWNGSDALPTDDRDLLLISLVSDVMTGAYAA